jgi:hypothetical protein
MGKNFVRAVANRVQTELRAVAAHKFSIGRFAPAVWTVTSPINRKFRSANEPPENGDERHGGAGIALMRS